uniref:Bm11711 n=1 Tax=Brugia malayi TaxID=6279 RepID=A0A1I9G7M1_BRUMA|nr:Bm11711 [Brugia malayi]
MHPLKGLGVCQALGLLMVIWAPFAFSKASQRRPSPAPQWSSWGTGMASTCGHK